MTALLNLWIAWRWLKLRTVLADPHALEPDLTNQSNLQEDHVMGIIGQEIMLDAYAQSAKELVAKALEDWGGDLEKADEVLWEALRDVSRQRVATLPWANMADDQPF